MEVLGKDLELMRAARERYIGLVDIGVELAQHVGVAPAVHAARQVDRLGREMPVVARRRKL